MDSFSRRRDGDAQEDFLIRAIRRVTGAVAALVGLGRGASPEAADEILDEAYQDLLGLDLRTLSLLPLDVIDAAVREKGLTAPVTQLLEEECRLRRALGDAPRVARLEALLRRLTAR